MATLCGNHNFTNCTAASKSSNNGNGKTSDNYGYPVDMSGDWTWKEDEKVINQPICAYDNYIKNAAKELNIDWRLCAALAFVESGFDKNAKNKNAKGLWQIIYWKDYAPSGYKDNENYAYNPQISTLAFKKKMREYLNRYKNAATVNDRIALAFQCWHDGSLGIPSITYVNRTFGKYGNSVESKKYFPNILKKYREWLS